MLLFMHFLFIYFLISWFYFILHLKTCNFSVELQHFTFQNQETHLMSMLLSGIREEDE